MATAQLPLTHHQSSTPDLDELEKLGLADRLAMAAAIHAAMERGLQADGTRLAKLIGPQTNEELLDAVQELTGHRIPRNAVCIEHGHTSPAETFCDLFFERVHNVLWIGNRGGGKTANSGELHGAKCRWKPGYESAIAGAVEKQGYRAYAEFQRFTRKLGNEILDSLLSKTKWANGSLTEVLGGTIKQLNGPHPHLAQMDEVELTTVAAFEEFLNMAQGDSMYEGQQLLTSTRKKAYGIVQGIVKECEQAIKQGVDPPWDVRIFCVFETMQQVPNCRSAPENKGRPEEELCNCNTVKKGVWENGEDRIFADVCGGRAYRADGFVQLADVQKRFRQLSRFTWEAQQECLTPELEGVVHKWLKEKHYIYTWLPHGFFGPILRGWDWGGTNPHAVVWCQLLTMAVGLDAAGLPVLDDDEDHEIVEVIPEGTLVQFDEIYKTSDELPGDGGFSDLAQVVADREVEWRTFGFEMAIAMDACDPAGHVAKREVRKRYRQLVHAGRHPGLKVMEWKSIPVGIDESVRIHISYGEGGKVRIVPGMCPRTLDEYAAYHWPDKRDGKNLSEVPVDEDNHAMDAKRYLIWNWGRLEDRGAHASGEPPAGQHASKPDESPVASTNSQGGKLVGPITGAAPPTPAPDGSPVGGIPRGGGGGRIREQALPSVRQVAPGRGYR